jgi:hypothetical protein
VLLVLIIAWLKKKVAFTLENVLIMAFLISYTCVLFLPSMHERYGFIYEILGLMLAFWFVKTIPLLVLMYFSSIATYSNYLFRLSTNSTVLGVSTEGLAASTASRARPTLVPLPHTPEVRT